jgi:hypothetical protein
VAGGKPNELESTGGFPEEQVDIKGPQRRDRPRHENEGGPSRGHSRSKGLGPARDFASHCRAGETQAEPSQVEQKPGISLFVLWALVTRQCQTKDPAQVYLASFPQGTKHS